MSNSPSRPSIAAQTGKRARLAALHAVLCLIAAASHSAAGADSAVVNVIGYTPTSGGWHRFEALEFDDEGRVTRTHARRPAAFADGTAVTDGNGATLLPGLIDAHAHLLSQVLTDSRVVFNDSKSLAEAQLRVADWLKANPDHTGWLRGRGWNQVLWPVQAFPTAAALDEIVPDRPAYFKRIDGHAAWVNSAALNIAGITAATEDPVGGRLIRDDTGQPTGVLIDNAMDLVRRHIPASSDELSEEDLRKTIARLNAQGLTGLHQAGISIADVQRLDRAYDREPLPLRIYAMLDAKADLDKFGAPWLARHADRLTVRSVKLYADGALGSRGAAMIEPYNDEPESYGLLFNTRSEIDNDVRRVHEAGYQAAIHAIGDAANRQALDAIEAVIGKNENVLRHRIEHVQVVHPDDIPRIAALGVIASMQPVHAVSDMNMAEDRVGQERIGGAYAWRTLLDSGAVVASGSDFPVELTNPFLGIHAAVTRSNTTGKPAGGWYRNEAMTRIEAITTHPLSAAYAGHQESTQGSLEPGKWADFILLDRDIMSSTEDTLWSTRVLETWIAGKRVYRIGEETGDSR